MSLDRDTAFNHLVDVTPDCAVPFAVAQVSGAPDPARSFSNGSC